MISADTLNFLMNGGVTIIALPTMIVVLLLGAAWCACRDRRRP